MDAWEEPFDVSVNTITCKRVLKVKLMYELTEDVVVRVSMYGRVHVYRQTVVYRCSKLLGCRHATRSKNPKIVKASSEQLIHVH